mgnify:CR=1 FL=1
MQLIQGSGVNLYSEVGLNTVLERVICVESIMTS